MGRSSRLSLWIASLWLVTASPALALTRCDLTFDLESWSVFYKEGHGRGVIDCDNGQRANVVLEAKGAGISLGASKIVDGNGNFSLLTSIDEVYGARSPRRNGSRMSGRRTTQHAFKTRTSHPPIRSQRKATEVLGSPAPRDLVILVLRLATCFRSPGRIC